MKRRKGGAVSSFVALVILAIIFLTVLQHIIPIAITGTGASSANSSGSSPTRGSCTAEQVIGGAAQASPRMESVPNALMASYVVYLPVNIPSRADGELLNDSWWREVFASSGQSFADMPQGLYWGFLNDSRSMQDWVDQNMPDRPSWAAFGVMSGVQKQLAAVKSNATASRNSTVAKDSVRDFVTSLSGKALAGADFLTAGSL